VSEEEPTPAEAVLADALPVAFPFADWGDRRQREEAAWSLLGELAGFGWELVPVPSSLLRDRDDVESGVRP
jgi:hypothetical protein